MDATLLQTSRRRRLRLFQVLTLLAGAKLAGSLFEIQVLSHERFEARAQDQQERRIEISSRRGAIYDRNGVPLAVNSERYALYLVPNHVRDPRAFLDAFTRIVPYDREELRARLARGGFYVPLRRTVDRETVKRLEAARLEGIGVETRHQRTYPHGRLAAAVLGQVDVDSRGIAGIELQYDAILRGTPGWAVHQRDGHGHEYAGFGLPAVQPVNGGDVVLTIDVALQEIAEEALEEAMVATRAGTGSVVIADPGTGEILAMANRPDADPNVARGPIRNYAAVDLFEPGSTFKLVTLAGLYENGLARPDEEIFCENGSYVFASRNKPVRDVHPYGLLTVEDVIGKSSNICTIKLAQRLGNERTFEHGRRFGFGVPTGLDFPGEARGVFRLPREWSVLSPYSIAMGYEVSVTAVQLTMMFAAIANGGELLQPYLVRRATGPGGEVLWSATPRRVRRVISSATARLITQALVRVVREGTGTRADLELLQVAGKSGTAYKIREGGGGYASDRYNSSFGGFFPADDPRFVVFVRLDDPRGQHYGGLVAAPVFKKAIETTLFAERAPVDSSFFSGIRQAHQVVRLASWNGAAPAAPAAAEVAYGPPPRAPGLAGALSAPSGEASPELAVGTSLPAGRALTGGAGTEYAAPRPAAEVGAAGSAYPTAGADGPRPPHTALDEIGVRVPDFTAMSLREALVVASQRGLDLRFTGAGAVTAQEPAPGRIVPPRSAVRVENDAEP